MDRYVDRLNEGPGCLMWLTTRPDDDADGADTV
jgi:hypothetical protein